MSYWTQDTPPKKRTEIFVKEMNELYEQYEARNK